MKENETQIKFSSKLDVSLSKAKHSSDLSSKIFLNTSKLSSKSVTNMNRSLVTTLLKSKSSTKERTRSLSSGSNSSINLNDSLLNKKFKYNQD